MGSKHRKMQYSVDLPQANSILQRENFQMPQKKASSNSDLCNIPIINSYDSNQNYLPPIQRRYSPNGADINDGKFDLQNKKVINMFEKQNKYLSQIASNMVLQDNQRIIDENKRLEEKMKRLKKESLIKDQERKMAELLIEKSHSKGQTNDIEKKKKPDDG